MRSSDEDPERLIAYLVLELDPGPRLYNQGTPHPTAWYQEHGAGSNSSSTAGRSWYTSLGHTNETWMVSYQTIINGDLTRL